MTRAILLQTFKTAPLLTAAAVLAALIAIACLIHAVPNAVRSSEPSASVAGAGNFAPHNTRDSALCSKVYAQLKPRGLNTYSQRHASEPAHDAYQQAALVHDSPSLRRGNLDVLQPYWTSGSQAAIPIQYRNVFFVVDIEVTGVDLNTRTVSLVFAVAPGMLDSAGALSALPFPSSTNLSLIFGSATSGAYSLPLSGGVFHRGRSYVAITLPLQGEPADYPRDVYLAEFNLVSVAADFPRRPEISFEADVGEANGAYDLRGTARTTVLPGIKLRLPDGQTCGKGFSLEFRRGNTSLFIWVIALLPVVFVLLVFYELLSRLRELRRAWVSLDATAMVPEDKTAGDAASRGRLGRENAAVGIETGVAFVAILPLRAVLVPSSLSSVTTIDYVLGAELATLVLLLVLLRLLDVLAALTDEPSQL